MGFSVLRGKYVYLKESVYVRDKRTMTRKPRKLGSGNFNQNKYVTKKETYIGKLVKIETPKQFYLYETFLLNRDIKDFNKFLEEIEYDALFDSYLEYLHELYNITKEDFEKKNIVYYTDSCIYFSLKLIDWTKSFKFSPKYHHTDRKEMERFIDRCELIGIIHKQVIMALYEKLCPKRDENEMIAEMQREIDGLDKKKMKKLTVSDIKDFIS